MKRILCPKSICHIVMEDENNYYKGCCKYCERYIDCEDPCSDDDMKNCKVLIQFEKTTIKEVK